MEAEQPIELHETLHETMNRLARILDVQLSELHGAVSFALFVVQFGDGPGHGSHYVSNASNALMLATLKEFIAKKEGRYAEPRSKQ